MSAVLFATNRASRKADREELLLMISRKYFGGGPVCIEAVTVTDTHRVYRATRPEGQLA